MRETNKINTQSLQEEAKKSEDKEAFTVLARMPNCRVGVGARLESHAKPIFFIEIIASLCANHQTVNLNSLEKNMLILRRLKQRGYVLTCGEDGTISCELAVPPESLETEIGTAILMIEKLAE